MDMTNEDLRALILKLTEKYGRSNVCRQLVIAGLSPSHASLIARNKYERDPRPLVMMAVRLATKALEGDAA